MSRLMDSAERLVARYGVEGATSRQILLEAGQTNKNAIAQYFGDKDGLLKAIFNRRIEQMNVRRSELIEQATREDKSDNLITLLEIIYMPITEMCEEKGQYTYAMFLEQLMQYHPFDMQWPFLAPDAYTVKDGKLTFYLQSEKPANADEARNWLPTPKSGPFQLAGRFYGPTTGLIDGSYPMPKISEQLQ